MRDGCKWFEDVGMQMTAVTLLPFLAAMDIDFGLKDAITLAAYLGTLAFSAGLIMSRINSLGANQNKLTERVDQIGKEVGALAIMQERLAVNQAQQDRMEHELDKLRDWRHTVGSLLQAVQSERDLAALEKRMKES